MNDTAMGTKTIAERLSRYEKMFGKILFADEQPLMRRQILENPGGKYMYSHDGMSWYTLPQDTGKIDYASCMLRRIPEGVSVGPTKELFAQKESYEYSTDNGVTWQNVNDTDDGKWVYHGKLASVWFRRKSA